VENKISFVLQDGKGQKVGCYSSCLDITYAQAEVLVMAEQTKKDHPDGFILGFADTKLQITVDRFLEPHKAYPERLKKIEEYRAKIKEKGLGPLILREFFDDNGQPFDKDMLVQVGRAVNPFVEQWTAQRLAGEDEDVESMVEDAYANPLHVGVHLDFKPSTMDETWITDAAKSIKRTGVEKWLRRMLHILRFYLKGQPLTPLPNKNDRCPCGSTKKYGKCCGQGVEHEDPDDCKLGKHQMSSWQKVQATPESVKLIRSCEKCFRVFEPPWFEEIQVEEALILVVGCRACSSKPTREEIKTEIAEAKKWDVCPCCSKPFEIQKLVLEHVWEDGKHMDGWTATQIDNKGEQVDLQSYGLGKAVFVHKDCFRKALPGWPKVAKNSAVKPVDAEL